MNEFLGRLFAVSAIGYRMNNFFIKLSWKFAANAVNA